VQIRESDDIILSIDEDRDGVGFAMVKGIEVVDDFAREEGRAGMDEEALEPRWRRLLLSLALQLFLLANMSQRRAQRPKAHDVYKILERAYI